MKSLPNGCINQKNRLEVDRRGEGVGGRGGRAREPGSPSLLVFFFFSFFYQREGKLPFNLVIVPAFPKPFREVAPPFIRCSIKAADLQRAVASDTKRPLLHMLAYL